MRPLRPPRVLAVDLTPVLPGGENGGAKVFSIRLVARLASLVPDTSFVLLTQRVTHEELAALDARNVRRECVLDAAASGARDRLSGIAGMVGRMPQGLQATAGAVGYRVNAHLKRRGAAGLLARIGAEALLCPFTAPTLREPGVPAICTIYDLQFRAHPEFFAAADAAQRSAAFDDACAHAQALIAISDFTRDAAIAAAKLDPARIRTIPLRLGAPAPSAAPLPATLGLARGGYVLYPANFWRHKNHEALVAAFARARGLGLDPGLRLVLTGAFHDREDAVRDAAARAGVADRVVLAGFVDRDAHAALLRDARALVFPSLHEGFGLPLVEAMARGIPVASSDAAALPETAAGAARLFDPRDEDSMARAIVAVCADEALRARLVAAGTARAAELSDADAMARDYWTAICEATAAAGAPA